MRLAMALTAGAALVMGGCGLAGPATGGIATPGSGSLASMQTQARAVTISRDAWGVPTIEAVDEEALAFGTAYAMAEDGFYALEEAYAVALGRTAARTGSSAIPRDLLRRALGAEAQARATFAAAAPAERRIWASFADGVNYFLHTNPSVPPRYIARFEGWMVAAVAQDAAIVQALANALDGRDDEAPVVWTLAQTAPEPRALMLVSSASAAPYELTLRTPSWNVRGITALGVPHPREGFNASVAFADVHQDVRAHLRRIVFDNAADPMSYRVIDAHNSASGDVMRGRATARMDSIHVNTTTGMTIQLMRIVSTEIGPVVGARGDTSIVFTALETLRSDMLHRWRSMSRAAGAAGLRQAFALSPALRNAAGVDASGASVHGGADSLLRISPASAGWARQREAAALALLGSDSVWNSDAMMRTAFDTRMYAADDTIAALVSEWEQVGAANPERAMRLDSAVSLLRSWDRRAVTTSNVTTLYAALADQLTIMEPTAYPHFRALEIVVNDRRRFPPPAWGSVNAVARKGSLPGLTGHGTAGAPARHGGMFAYDANESGQRYAWVARLGADGVSAMSVLAYGQQSAPDLPHWMDQASLFAAGRAKTVVGPGSAAAGTPYHPGTAR